MTLTWYEFVMDARNRLWIRGETTLIRPLIVLLDCSIIDWKILASFSVARLFLDPELLQTGLLNLCVVILGHARWHIVLEIEQCWGEITKLTYIIEGCVTATRAFSGTLLAGLAQLHFLVCNTWQFSICILCKSRLGVLFATIIAPDYHLIRLLTKDTICFDRSWLVVEFVFLELALDIRRFMSGQTRIRSLVS